MLKIVDFQYEDTIYSIETNTDAEIQKLKYPQKKIKLEYKGQLYDLKIDNVDDDGFILKLK